MIRHVRKLTIFYSQQPWQALVIFHFHFRLLNLFYLTIGPMNHMIHRINCCRGVHQSFVSIATATIFFTQHYCDSKKRENISETKCNGSRSNTHILCESQHYSILNARDSFDRYWILVKSCLQYPRFTISSFSFASAKMACSVCKMSWVCVCVCACVYMDHMDSLWKTTTTTRQKEILENENAFLGNRYIHMCWIFYSKKKITDKNLQRSKSIARIEVSMEFQCVKIDPNKRQKGRFCYLFGIVGSGGWRGKRETLVGTMISNQLYEIIHS